MNIETLQKQIEHYYNEKGIARCRYNALSRVILFVKQSYKDSINDVSSLNKIDKQELKKKYEYQKDNKIINGAEKQAVNDIYNYIQNSVMNDNSNSVCLKSIPTQIVKENNYKQGLGPWVGKFPQILILGSMPGDESIRQQIYYANTSHNSFWKIMYSLFHKKENLSNKEFITSYHIALWDCANSGIRTGSTDMGFDDKSIIPNDLKSFLHQHPTIKTIIINGKGKPLQYYKSYFSDENSCKLIVLNSTSNTCSKPFDIKKEEWSIVKELIKNE